MWKTMKNKSAYPLKNIQPIFNMDVNIVSNRILNRIKRLKKFVPLFKY